MTEAEPTVAAPKAKRPRAPKPRAPGDLTIALDGADLSWLEAQAYPLGVSAADYLRMFVRQSRLGVNGQGMEVRGPQTRQQHRPSTYGYTVTAIDGSTSVNTAPRPGSAEYAEAQHHAGDPAVDELIAAAVAEAPAYNPLADFAPPPDSAGNVVSLTQRAPQVGPDGPRMSVQQAFGG